MKNVIQYNLLVIIGPVSVEVDRQGAILDYLLRASLFCNQCPDIAMQYNRLYAFTFRDQNRL